ncbi:MAG TPA: helix-turn-helix domain-containing protein [bacterium]|nr:helix-turn-helix domain-containing protein [bacterium]HMW31994.1 helix-turn-helix domain-containing protein [bacterium]HMW35050.1 helix-turn-helix domain-containing protein [bacterium]HMY36262.1 helix-turn-helix domain-containing protein [bacterium]HMZ05768.1 helix-turn-helix domain-containing protein [bacterium]
MKKQLPFCPVNATLNVIGGRWKPVILNLLREDTLRFSALKRQIPGITQKMLTQQLRELEQDGIVRREVFPEVPPRVEYSLTEFGQSLKPILKAMCSWGSEHRRYLDRKLKENRSVEEAA